MYRTITMEASERDETDIFQASTLLVHMRSFSNAY